MTPLADCMAVPSCCGCVCWGGGQDLIEGDEGFVQPAARRNEVLGWVKEGLRDFSISRAAVSWGIPLPRDPSQTVYVWFDALLGYMSGVHTRHSNLPTYTHPQQVHVPLLSAGDPDVIPYSYEGQT
jgi:hypothetical protein